MDVIIEDNKPVIITELNTIRFDLPKDVNKNLKHEIDFIIKHNEFLAKHRIKNKISQSWSNKHGNNIHKHGKE